MKDIYAIQKAHRVTIIAAAAPLTLLAAGLTPPSLEQNSYLARD
jgi:hypothetical protein